MKTFRDNLGRTWHVDIDVAAVERVRELCGVDLLKLVEDSGDTVLALSEDLPKLVDVLYAVCKPEVDAYPFREPRAGRLGRFLWRCGVGRPATRPPDEMFGVGLRGDCLEHAWDALLGDLVDFFPQGRRRLLRTAALQAGLRSVLGIREKLRALADWEPPTSARKSTASPDAAAWPQARSLIASCCGWTAAPTNKPPG